MPVPLSSLSDTINAAAQQYGLDPNLLLRQARQESGFNPNAVSKAGAIGVMQLMPGTAKDLGVNPNDPTANIYGGAHYMRQLLDRYNGDYRLALMAYNAGPGRVDAYLKGGKLPAETQNYAPAILGPSAGVPLASIATQPAQPEASPDSSPDLGAALTLRQAALIGHQLRNAQAAFNAPIMVQ